MAEVKGLDRIGHEPKRQDRATRVESTNRL